jgi:hypothetical protein
MAKMRARVAGALIGLGFGACALVSCGDDGESSATEEACDARAELSSDLDQVQQDMSDGNLGDAEGSLEEVRSSFGDFVDATTDVAAEQKQQLAPLIDQLEADLSAIGDVGSIDELRTALDAVQADIENLSAAADDDLGC